jgi:hypothetical protein
MAYTMGFEAKLLRGEAGATGTTEVKNVKDLSLTLESGDADVTTRAANGWKVSQKTLKDASIEFGMKYDAEDEDIIAFRDAFLNNTAIALFVSDGLGNGVDADWMIMSFSIDQPLEDAIGVSVKAKPTMITRAPAWKTAQTQGG